MQLGASGDGPSGAVGEDASTDASSFAPPLPSGAFGVLPASFRTGLDW
jgi:hypothetical protein